MLQNVESDSTSSDQQSIDITFENIFYTVSVPKQKGESTKPVDFFVNSSLRFSADIDHEYFTSRVRNVIFFKSSIFVCMMCGSLKVQVDVFRKRDNCGADCGERLSALQPMNHIIIAERRPIHFIFQSFSSHLFICMRKTPCGSAAGLKWGGLRMENYSQ